MKTQSYSVPINVRGQVAYFAQLMELVLRDNDNKPGWSKCTPLWLHAKLTEEIGELGKLLTGLYHPTDSQPYQMSEEQCQKVRLAMKEAIDIGNVAMMLADVLSEMT